jgi:hypothetical protein
MMFFRYISLQSVPTLPLGPKYLLRHSILECPQPVLCPYCERCKLHKAIAIINESYSWNWRGKQIYQ